MKERRTWWLEWSRRLTITRITRFVRLRCCNAHHEELRRTIFMLTSADSAFHPNYCIRVTDVLEREMRLAYNTDSGSFSKKRKVGKHGHSSYLVAKTSIDAFYQQFKASVKACCASINNICEVPCDQMNTLEGTQYKFLRTIAGKTWRDHRLKEESNSIHQFLSKWLASINMNTKEQRTWWLEY